MPDVKQSRRFEISDLIRQVFISWLLAVTIEYLLLPAQLRDLAQLEGLANMSLVRVIVITLAGTVLLWGISRRVDTTVAERWGLVGILVVLSGLVLLTSFTKWFLAICVLMLSGAAVFAIFGWNRSAETVVAQKKEHKCYLWITAGLAVVFFLMVCAWTVGRVLSYGTSSFDMGIFTQMFHNMAESGLPMTTVERDKLLSHFHVHMSPIFYLMLPFYWLFPSPVTLQVMQAAILASAVIPLWKLCKLHGLSDLQRMLVCAVLLMLPAFAGGISYDLHENCFLTPLILWLLYAIDKRNTALTAVFAVLTLMVKEDAAVYVAVIALWLIVKSAVRLKKGDYRDLITGVVLLAGALIYFIAVTTYLAEVGDGVMSYRYKNFMYDGSDSLVTVIKAVIMNPMKAVYECVDWEKLEYISLTMLPLLGLPLLTRRYERYLLLIPYVLINLMSDYQYQHNVYFQYSFGSIACLIYLVVVNLADLKINWHRVAALAAAVVISACCFSEMIIPYVQLFPKLCIENREQYESVQEALELVPEDASVTASTYFTTHLARRETLYDIAYASKEHVLNSDYIVLSVKTHFDFERFATDGENDGFENFSAIVERNGYEVFYESEYVLIYQKTK